jgi:hypothetical protein
MTQIAKVELTKAKPPPLTDAQIAQTVLGEGKHQQLTHLRTRDEIDLPGDDGQMKTSNVLVLRKGWQMWLTRHEIIGPCVAIWSERLAVVRGCPEPAYIPMNNVASAIPK